MKRHTHTTTVLSTTTTHILCTPITAYPPASPLSRVCALHRSYPGHLLLTAPTAGLGTSEGVRGAWCEGNKDGRLVVVYPNRPVVVAQVVPLFSSLCLLVVDSFSPALDFVAALPLTLRCHGRYPDCCFHSRLLGMFRVCCLYDLVCCM
ncbi:hypothetical protein FRC08_014076 [Ceratobasidium sp. 394]|nr:hypothetical protein FRC08_014076 [Ceratobasidium sp. 394]